MAIASPRVRADVVEVSGFPHLVERYSVYRVPKVVINDRVSFEGALPESVFLGHVLEGVASSAEASGS